MTAEHERALEVALCSDRPVAELVTLLRQYKEQGLGRGEAYAFLESVRERVTDQATEDRVLEVADFVAGFCAPHMRIWDDCQEDRTIRHE